MNHRALDWKFSGKWKPVLTGLIYCDICDWFFIMSSCCVSTVHKKHIPAPCVRHLQLNVAPFWPNNICVAVKCVSIICQQLHVGSASRVEEISWILKSLLSDWRADLKKEKLEKLLELHIKHFTCAGILPLLLLLLSLAEAERSQRLPDVDAAQQLKLRERQRFFEEVFQHDVDVYLSSAHLCIRDYKRRELGL